MNPFGIFSALLGALDCALHAANPKRKRETKWQQRRFLFFYFTALLLGLAYVIWSFRS